MHRVKTISRRDFLAAGTMTGVAAGAASSPALGLLDFNLARRRRWTCLITGCDIVTFDKADRVVTDGAIAVQGNTIDGSARPMMPPGSTERNKPSTLAAWSRCPA